MGQDVVYTIENECGCCEERGCHYQAGCFFCTNTDGSLSLLDTGYTCLGGNYIVCDPTDPSHTIGIPCTKSTRTSVSVTFNDFSPGNGVCTIQGGTYILSNYWEENTIQCLGGVADDECTWIFGGSDIQFSPDPSTRCTQYSSCSECTQNGPTTTFPIYRAYSGFSIIFSYVDTTGYTGPQVAIGFGNVIFPGGRCLSVSKTYHLAVGTVLNCVGPTTFITAQEINSAGLPNSVTVEIL